MHIDQRALLQPPAQRAAQRGARRFGERRIVAAQRRRQIGQRLGKLAGDPVGLRIVLLEQARAR